jgi:hypothetical protein
LLLRQGFGLIAKLYILGATTLALILLATSLITGQLVVDREILLTAAVLGLISLLLEFIDFPLLIGGATSFSTVTYIAMVFMLPFPLPAIVGVAVVLAADLRTRRPLYAMTFNAANFVLTFGISSLIWHLSYGSKPIDELPVTPWSLLVVLVIIVVFYAINVFLMNGLIAIVGQRSIKYIWLTNDFDMLLPYICHEVIGTLVALIWSSTPILTPLLIIPAITSYIAFEMIHRLQHQTQEAMIAMADAIDQRDPYTADHSRRVAELAVKIAEVHNVNERDIERLRIAARMHDIGKIGIGNDLLHKPGKLTDDEWEILRAHPVIGEQLLKPYRQFRHETRLVRHHHERWDGKGYPDRVRGQAIPLGARIIAVADTFDAMTTSRPYRPALSRQYAIDEIRNGALSQFDPQIVASFLQVMEESSKIRSITGEDLPPSVNELEQAPAWYSSLP